MSIHVHIDKLENLSGGLKHIPSGRQIGGWAHTAKGGKFCSCTMTKVAPYPECTGCKCRIDTPYYRFVKGLIKLSNVTAETGGNGDAFALVKLCHLNAGLGCDQLQVTDYS